LRTNIEICFGKTSNDDFDDSGVKTGIGIQSKIYQKTKSTWDGILASILMDLGRFAKPSWEGEWKQK